MPGLAELGANTLIPALRKMKEATFPNKHRGKNLQRRSRKVKKSKKKLPTIGALEMTIHYSHLKGGELKAKKL